MLPVRELAALGVPLLVDGAQAVGAVPVAAAETDAALDYDETGAFTPRNGAARFDTGWLSRAVLEGLLASLSFADEVGESRFARARELADRCRQLLAERVELVTQPRQATLVSWVSDDAAGESRRLAERGVVVRNLPNLPWVRASVGFWTSEEDLIALSAGVGARRRR